MKVVPQEGKTTEVRENFFRISASGGEERRLVGSNSGWGVMLDYLIVPGKGRPSKNEKLPPRGKKIGRCLLVCPPRTENLRGRIGRKKEALTCRTGMTEAGRGRKSRLKSYAFVARE